MPTKTTWRKSSHSGGNCVEVGFFGPLVAVRDSKRPGSGALVVQPKAWRALVRAC